MAQLLAPEGTHATRDPRDAPDAAGARDAADPSDGTTPPDGGTTPPGAAATPTHEPLPLVALVLGVAGVALGVTVIWFFAAIPIGIVSVAVGLVARRRVASYRDPRAASRATIGTALGCVAILLGVTGAYFLPQVMDRTDRFVGSVQDNVNGNVDVINNGLSEDVNKLDRTLSHDLHRFELQNRDDLTGLENRTALTMKALEDRLHSDVGLSSVAAKRDLELLETSLRADMKSAELDARNSDTVLRDAIDALDARLTRLEHEMDAQP